MNPMNPIRDLADLVEQQSDASTAAAVLADYIARSDLQRTQLEKTLDAFRRALREHLQAQRDTPDLISCSFCHKSEDEVAAIVVASSAAICDECTKLSGDVIAGRAKKASGRSKIGAVLDLVARRRRGT